MGIKLPDIHVYYISDDYKLHFITDNLNEFRQRLISYTTLLSTTNKQNRYDFGNWLMSGDEYATLMKNHKFRAPNHHKPHLKLL